MESERQLTIFDLINKWYINRGTKCNLNLIIKWIWFKFMVFIGRCVKVEENLI